MKYSHRISKAICFLLLAISFFVVTSAAHAQRVALLIGNSKYQAAPLNNPVNDVREMEAALTSLGFKVQKVLDVNQNQMKRAVRDFGAVAQGAEVAFVYYSGHGTQANGENYLLPIGASIDKESDYEVEAVSANALMRQIAGARPKAAIVVLDACRDNPYAGVTKSTAKGLGRMDAPTGTMIAFATSPNTTASDDGYYARVLAARLKIPGVELLDVFRDTTAEVRRLSGGKQEPRISEMSITDRIYLAGQTAVVAAQPKPPVISLSSPNMEASTILQTGQVFKDCADCPDMVVIPAGTFIMGSPENEKDRQASDGPQRRVNVKTFAMGKTEVTVAQFRKFVDEKNYQTDAERNIIAKGCYIWDVSASKSDWREGRSWRNPGWSISNDEPVACISHNDATAYTQWLAESTNKKYQLPSEAQWEYAARSGSQTSRPWGENPNEACRHANVADTTKNPFNGTSHTSTHDCSDGYWFVAPVGSYQANSFGLYDMLGNVWEWTKDVWHEDYTGAPKDGSAWLDAGNQQQRVLRGGAMVSSPQYLRSALRLSMTLGVRLNTFGFRVSRVI